MYKTLPLDLRTCVENLDFWASTEVRPGCDRRQMLETFDELADRARRLAAPEHRDWLEGRILLSRRRIDRRVQPRRLEENTISAVSKNHRDLRAAPERRQAP